MRYRGESVRLKELYLVLLLVLFSGSTSAAAASFTPDQERILQVTVGKYRFDDPLLCYQVGDTLLLPLGQLAQMIDLAVKTYPVSGHAEGFIFDQNRTFTLDIGQRLVVVAGVAQPLDPERVRVAADDIYVDAALLANWFPFSVEPNLLNSQLNIRSKRPLPFEERLNREARAKQLTARSPSQLPSYPRRDEPYQMWEMPFIDQTLRGGVARDTQGNHSSTYAYTTYGTGDLFNMESSWYLAGTQQAGSDTFRMTLSRHDPDGKLLEPVGLTEVSLGNVLEPRVGLINLPTSTSKVGVLFGNAPLYRSSTYDTHTFVGDLLPGWEVELYQNNVLLGFQQPNTLGQYRFEDVPLLYGSNYFRLVFYGPQGQRYEETQNFEIGQNLTPVGKQTYRVMSRQDELGGNRTIVEYNAGLLSNLSFAGNLVSMPLTEADGSVRQHDYLRAGLNTSLSRAVLSLGMINDTAGGSAVETRLQGRLGNSVLGVNHTQFRDFVSEEFTPTQLAILSRTQLRFDSIIPTTSWTLPLPLSIQLQRDTYKNNVENRQADLRLSMQQHGLAISNQLSWRQYGAASTTTTGVLQTAIHYGNVGVRADYQYALAPTVESTSFTLAGDLTNYHGYNFTAAVTHTMALHTTYTTAGVSRDFGRFLGFASLRYGNQGDYLAEVGVSFSLGRNPRNNDWLMQSRSLAHYGAVAPQAFLDENGNGTRDAGEQPLSGVGIQFNGITRPQRTDEQGNALVTGAFPYMPLGVSVDNTTLGDPAYYPEKQGISVVNRPGHVVPLDVPVMMTGEVDGTVNLIKEGKNIAVGGVELQLVAADGTVIQRTKTAYDGYYLFSKVPMGAYEVKIDPEQTERLGLVEPEPQAAPIQGPDWYSSGIDFYLELEKKNEM